MTSSPFIAHYQHLIRHTEAAKMDFLRKQARRRVESDYLFFDCTSISSYSE
jgi:hypothetical protein